jgi:hypothetical protein
MPKTIHWTDGTEWTVDEPTFDRVMLCLGAVRENIWGFEALFSKLSKLAEEQGPIVVDSFAPSEEDRAVVTAALERAVEYAKEAGAETLGFEEQRDYVAFLDTLKRLHELFVTDVTHKLPRKGYP